MAVLKLESFSHDVEIRKGISQFESFEALRQNAYNDGVKNGAEAATRAFEAEKLRTLGPILEALNDMAFSQIEARHVLLTSLKPMIESLVSAVLPHCARQGLASEIEAIITAACEKSPQSRIIIQVAPDAVAAISAMLAPAKADFIVKGDEALDALRAKISWQGGYDALNLDAALSDMRAVVDDFFSPAQMTGTNNA